MIQKLLLQVFEKLSTEKENDNKSKNGYFVYFVEEVLERKFNKPNLISDRSLKNYYEKYVEGVKNTSGEPKLEIKNYLSMYLGYNDYLDFEKSNSEDNPFVNKFLFPLKKWSFLNVVVVGILAVFFLSVKDKRMASKIKKPLIEKCCNVKHTAVFHINDTTYHINDFEKIVITKKNATENEEVKTTILCFSKKHKN